MKKLTTFLALALSATVLTATPAKAEVIDLNDIKDSKNYIIMDKLKLNWSDEFDGNSLNEKYWTPMIGNGNDYNVWEWGNNEKEYYKRENISVSNGTLKLNAKYEPNAGKVGNTTYNFSSARLTSTGKVHTGLGYVEARIKIPSAKGIWPAFWQLGTNGKVWPSCGEIDIMEAFNTTKVAQSTIHFPDGNGKDVYKWTQKILDDKTQWHTYGAYRDGKFVAFFVDGQLIGNYKTEDIIGNEKSELRSVLNDDYYFLLNVACGGNLAGGMPDTTLNCNMEVDYVRYYVGMSAEEIAQRERDKQKQPETTQPTTEKVTKVTVSKTKIKSLKNVKKRKLKVSLKKVAGAKGYQIRYCDNKKFNGYEEKKATKTKVTIKGLEKKVKYFVKARAYKVVSGKKYYSKWTSVKKIKIKK